MIQASSFFLISSPTSQPLHTLNLQVPLLFFSIPGTFLRALGFAISSAWNTENYVVHALNSLRSLFKCHLIKESFLI